MSGTGNTTSYSYIAVYKWVDNKGNIHQSAPSIPIHLAAARIPGSFHGAQIVVPTLQLTEKIGNPVQIDIYRWSTTQQVYYRVTNDSTPFLNNPATPYVVFTDSLINDNQIVGNPILYTTGGVLENIAPPSSNIAAIYDS
jgi:hypothetical protein